MRFACVGVVGAGEMLEDFADMEKLCSDANFESKKISEGYFTNIVTLLCRAYVGQQKNFTEETTLMSLEAFYGSLEQLRRQCGENALKNAMFSWEELGVRNVDLNEIFPDNLEKNDLSFCYITNGQGWQRLMAAERDYDLSYQELQNGNECYFATQNVLGINKNSAYKEQAMDFIKFALTERGSRLFRPLVYR